MTTKPDPLTDRILQDLRDRGLLERQSERAGTPGPVKSGQVRRLDGSYGAAGNLREASAVAVVVAVDRANSGATVALVISPWERATDRDILIAPTNSGLPYEAVVLTDVQATVFQNQLETSPILGHVDRHVLDLLGAAHFASTEALTAKAADLGVRLGEGRALPGSIQWLERERAANLLGALATDYTDPAPVFVDPAACAPPEGSSVEAAVLWTSLLEYALTHEIPTPTAIQAIPRHGDALMGFRIDLSGYLTGVMVGLLRHSVSLLLEAEDEQKVLLELLAASPDRTLTLISDGRVREEGLQSIPGLDGKPHQVNVRVPEELRHA